MELVSCHIHFWLFISLLTVVRNNLQLLISSRHFKLLIGLISILFIEYFHHNE